MDLAWSETDRRFREEVRDFLSDKLTPDLKKVEIGRASCRERVCLAV